MSLVEVCKGVGTGEGGGAGGSADNCCMFPTVDILEARGEAAEEIIQ